MIKSILIEAKRIKQGETVGKLNSELAFESIFADMNRMDDTIRLKRFVDTRKIDENHKHKIKIAKVMLSDIWVNDEMKGPFESFLSCKRFPQTWRLAVTNKFDILNGL